ncbi:putative TIM-barrel fold metal-dependent hydrolase [Candidatus Methanoperedens nitroreducens]|uniref:Putative TIM-barrel fold metal-dependent hydrolase n=1 Tax=Candidatus Methanoperedens nitratireducens TaxID=1392998 RepID=A0A062V3F1_9EURY|nr:amidohydrolase family protein [Candidatus Methanoperedens nitroreducens]KCZ71867.1 putative TIM-barrel fold metal-dependent hydrolase [Candidatus Methanoperedens nitroreducens]MDJ1422159.1 amidohydrolase family protein [Candidatus Methanoperedens sp.]
MAKIDDKIIQKFPVDAELAAFIDRIKAVDNHTHANTTAPEDPDADALPLHEISPFPVAVTLMPDHPNWVAAARALYGYPHAELSEAHMPELRESVGKVLSEQGDNFPTWVLGRIGTEVMLTNRVAMGPGLEPPRFRWVSFVDALMFPLSTRAEARVSPDREKFYPHQEALLRRYMADLKVMSLPPTLDAYFKTVVTPTIEAQQKAGCVAVKFEAALMRSLHFAEVPAQTANAVYARYVKGGVPSHAEYKALQDYIFRHIAREAGRLGMVVHVHSFEGPGSFYHTAEADPLLLESAITDPTLSNTNFLFVHGGGIFASHAGGLLWRPNVYVDTSGMAFMYPPERLARILRDWLTQHPDRVLFGSDAAEFGPDTPWELSAWIGITNARIALTIALSEMIRAGEVSRARAREIAIMVMRMNAAKLYKLGLK